MDLEGTMAPAAATAPTATPAAKTTNQFAALSGLDFLKKANGIIALLFRAFFKALLIVAVLTYIALCPPVLTTLFPALVLVPKSAGEEYKVEQINGINRQEIFFKSKDGQNLHAWYFRLPDPAAPVILYNHGNGGNLACNTAVAQRLMDAGASVFLYDYRGYGKSDGKPNVTGTLVDAESAYDFLHNSLKVPAEKIVIYGISYGGAAACHVASKKAHAGLILESTFSSLLHVARERLPYFTAYPECLNTNPPLDNVAVLKKKHAPLLIIHGTLDDVVPYSEAERNFAEASQPKQILTLPNAHHWFNDENCDLHVRAVRHFLKSTNYSI